MTAQLERPAMTKMQRVVAALTFGEPDRVPIVLPLALHGAKELGITVRELFADKANVLEGNMRLAAKYDTDIAGGTWYAPIEYEAWGGQVIFFDDGPPNSGAPVFGADAIERLEPPRPEDHPRTRDMLETISEMRRRLGPDVPILGGVVSPNSLPIMQMGFEAYLNLLLERRDLWWTLMARNSAWTEAWGKAQLAAGATALAYFDPVASATIVPPELYLETGFLVAKDMIARLACPIDTVLASGRALPVLPHLLATGTTAFGPSSLDDLAEVKRISFGKAAIVGNLNGIEMRHWTAAQAEAHVREVIDVAGAGGGLVICDNHGEIPYQVPEDTLHAIVEAVRTWGRYPLRGADA